ncbi:MAG TPA: hypothetical protein VIO35_09930 [Chloroflexota bacterium]
MDAAVERDVAELVQRCDRVLVDERREMLVLRRELPSGVVINGGTADARLLVAIEVDREEKRRLSIIGEVYPRFTTAAL